MGRALSLMITAYHIVATAMLPNARDLDFAREHA
jgi:hypothetical protein